METIELWRLCNNNSNELIFRVRIFLYSVHAICFLSTESVRSSRPFVRETAGERHPFSQHLVSTKQVLQVLWLQCRGMCIFTEFVLTLLRQLCFLSKTPILIHENRNLTTRTSLGQTRSNKCKPCTSLGQMRSNSYNRTNSYKPRWNEVRLVQVSYKPSSNEI